MVEQGNTHYVKVEKLTKPVDVYPMIGSIHGANFLPDEVYLPHKVIKEVTRISVVSGDTVTREKDVVIGPFYKRRVQFATWRAERAAHRLGNRK